MRKRNIIASLLLVVAGVQTAWAQKMVVTTLDNKQVEYDLTKVKDVTFFEAETASNYVDLELPSGTLWATCNIGAQNPEDYGDYFAWGETTPKNKYNWTTYQLSNGSSTTLKRYCTSSSYGTVDNKKELLAEDDAATAIWGSDWQMPSKKQFDELIDPSNTKTEWTRENGTYGRKITSLRNGKSIFLPAAGYYEDSSRYGDGDDAFYWSRSLVEELPSSAYMLRFYDESIWSDKDGRCYGMSIRPVRWQKPEPVYESVDLGLPSGTQWATFNVGASSPEEYGDYFAWGETKPKESFYWGNYKWMNDGQHEWSQINKYTCADNQTDACWYSSNGTFIGDGLTELLPEDDAATANWGDGWQMPSSVQIEELINSNYTSQELTTQNGVYGLKITSKKNGNSIFLPAAGRFTTSLDWDGYSCYYWSRSLDTGYSDLSQILRADIECIFEITNNREYGSSVRPVRKK